MSNTRWYLSLRSEMWALLSIRKGELETIDNIYLFVNWNPCSFFYRRSLFVLCSLHATQGRWTLYPRNKTWKIKARLILCEYQSLLKSNNVFSFRNDRSIKTRFNFEAVNSGICLSFKMYFIIKDKLITNCI